MVLIFATCNAQYVELNCDVLNANTELSCNSYTVKPSNGRSVVFKGPIAQNNGQVVTITLLHPSLNYFLVEIFTVFPNLRTLDVSIDGSAVLPQMTLKNAKNLESFRITKTTSDSLDPFAFYDGGNKLKEFVVDGLIHVDEFAFTGLSNLISLEITFSNIRLCSISPNALKPLTNLQSVFFWVTGIETIPGSFFANNLKLESIYIDEFTLFSVERTFIDNLTNLKKIKIFGGSGSTCNAEWTSPNPISAFHSAMAACYDNFI